MESMKSKPGMLEWETKSKLGDLLQRNQAAIVQHMNLSHLAPALAQNDLLDMALSVWKDDSMPSRTEFLHTVINNDSKVHLRFAKSVKAASSHLGHQYIISILEETEYDSEEAISLSVKYREAMKNNMTDMMGIDLPSLMPHLRKHNLLTEDEVTLLLCKNQLAVSQKMSLFSILHNKGPTAHYLFGLCLSEEKQHPPHQELWQRVCGETKELQCPSPQRKRPQEIKVRKPLKGKEYDETRALFEGHYHNERWDKVEELFRECLQNKQLEVNVIGYLENALSLIFRLNEKEATHYINLAKQVCQKIPSDNDNRTFLEGRAEYLLALLYLYLGLTQKAKEHIQKAMIHLFYMEVGEDKTFACYVDAKIAAAELSSTPTPQQLQHVTRLFTRALEYAEYSQNLDILIIYSLLRLCELYLYTITQSLTGTSQAVLAELRVAEQDNLDRASDCLERLRTTYYKSMDLRCQCIYKLAECSLHRCCGRVPEAIQSAEEAKRLVHGDSSYKVEVKRVKEALESLKEPSIK